MEHLSTAAAERLTLGLTLGLVALAALAPATHLPAHYHHFADQRALGGLPFAMDVLTNLPFALAGAWGLAWLRRATGLAQPQRALAALFFAGLALTALCSGIYHLHPENAGLALDRAGMAVAFAGVVGLAAADRVSGRAGLALAALLLALGPLAAVWDWRTGNMTPWAVLQAGGALLLALLALRRPHSPFSPFSPDAKAPTGALGFSTLGVLGIYALAKALEMGDHAVFHALHGVISGHSLKHVAAAAAAWPVLAALKRLHGRGLTH